VANEPASPQSQELPLRIR